MSNTFASLKRDRADALNKLTQELSKQNQNQANTNSGADTRFWKPTVDKAGNGQAIIRFLPAPVNEDVPFIRIWDHGFQGPGGWYIEKSLTTLGEKDPVSELNTRLWNSGVEADKEQVRKQKRRLHYTVRVCPAVGSETVVCGWSGLDRSGVWLAAIERRWEFYIIR